VDHWRDRFDWRAAERKLNTLPQFSIELDGQAVHYVHVKGVNRGSKPLVLTHGWPGSFVEMYRIIPLLVDPANNGLQGYRSFDVVVPSLPGFGFSQAPTSPGTNSRVVAKLWHALMGELGYSNYFAQGGDIGSGVTTWLARLYPRAVRALHLNFISGGYQPPLTEADPPLSVAEAEWLSARTRWAEREGGYSHVHATKPQTLAYGLTDSPVGLAAWLLEKFFAWSDGAGELTERFDLDELLTNLSIYWFSGNVASTLRMYEENSREPLRFDSGERIIPPLSFALFPKEIINPPREWVARVFTVARWTEMPVGGHFAALEQPRALAIDIHEAFSGL
jgi:pimeloyl-ACP methyl ester carboxylesterase